MPWVNDVHAWEELGPQMYKPLGFDWQRPDHSKASLKMENRAEEGQRRGKWDAPCVFQN